MLKQLRNIMLIGIAGLFSASVSAQDIFADSTSFSTAGLCLACNVTDAQNAVDGNAATFSSISATLGLLGGSVEQTLVFPTQGFAGDTVELLLNTSDQLLNLNVLGAITVKTLFAATDNGDEFQANNGSASLLGATSFMLRFEAVKDFDRVQITLKSGVAGLLKTTGVAYGKILRNAPGGVVNTCVNPIAASKVETCLLNLCSVTNHNAVVTSDPTDFAQMNVTLGLLGATVGVGANWDFPACSEDRVEITLERPGALLTLSLLEQVNAIAFNNGVEVYRELLQNNNLQLLNGSNKYLYDFQPNTDFDSIAVELNSSLLGLLSSLRVYEFCLKRVMPAQPDASLGRVTTACFGDSKCVNWGVPAGYEVKVFNDAARQDTIFEGVPPFCTGPLFQDTTFYVEAFNPTTGCKSALLDSIFIGVFEPIIPATVEDITVCYNVAGRIAPEPAGSTFRFYTDSLGTNEVFVGGAFVTEPVLHDTVYWVRNTIQNICVEAAAHKVNVRVYEEPVIARVPDTISVCAGSGDPVPVYVLGQSIPGLNITYTVYDRDTIQAIDVDGNPAVFSFPNDTAYIPVSSFNLGVVGDLDTIYVDATSNLCRESANKKPIILKSIAQPTSAPVVDTVYTCDGDSSRMFVNTPVSGARYFWYETAVGGVPVFEGDTVIIAAVDQTITYYVEANFGGCTSPVRGEAVVTPLSGTASNFYDLDQTICVGNPTLIVAQSAVGDDFVYDWYDAAVGGNLLLADNDSLQTTPINNDTTVYLQVNGLNCLMVDRFPANISVVNPPVANVADDLYYVCSGDDVALLANQNPVVAEIKWYDALVGGNLIGTGAPLNYTSSLTAGQSESVYVEANIDLCLSTDRAEIVIQNVESELSPSLNGEPSACEGESVVLTASSNWTDVEFSWYGQSNGGTEISRGAVFVTPPLPSGGLVVYSQIEFKDSVCVNRPRTPFNITTLPRLESPTALTCADTEGNRVRFEWDAVSGATEYSISYMIDNGTPVTMTTTDLFLEVNNLTEFQTVTLELRAVGSLDCETSEPAVASCTAGCPPNNSTLDQVFYEFCQTETQNIVINVDPSIDPASLEIGVIGQGSVGTQSTFVYPTDFTNTPDLTNTLSSPVYDTVIFYIRINGFGGCDSLVLPAVVKINPSPNVDPNTAIEAVSLVPPTVGQIVDEYQFISNIPGDVSWQWNFGDGSTSNEKNPVHKVALRDTPYQVSLSVSNGFGCSSTVNYSRDIVVSSVPDIFIPNTFTPNGDGKNDGFRVFGEAITLEYLRVYNQYGNLVFESKELDETWDGTHNDNEQPAGTYYYTAVIYDYLNLEYVKEGTVDLIRRNKK